MASTVRNPNQLWIDPFPDASGKKRFVALFDALNYNGAAIYIYTAGLHQALRAAGGKQGWYTQMKVVYYGTLGANLKWYTISNDIPFADILCETWCTEDNNKYSPDVLDLNIPINLSPDRPTGPTDVGFAATAAGYAATDDVSLILTGEVQT